ncbi:PIN domain-containing protein [Candidatus Woesearchaeota archaeon]|nr:PIN domain-containing protein [Candidatus Woesearchaeota archaeon]
MKFIDSNIIAYAFYDNPSREQCQYFLRQGGITNALNIVEAGNILEHNVSAENAAMSIRSLLRLNLQVIPLDTNLIFESLKRREKYKKLSIFDLIHYTTALLHNCQEIASYDKDFDGLELRRVE